MQSVVSEKNLTIQLLNKSRGQKNFVLFNSNNFSHDKLSRYNFLGGWGSIEETEIKYDIFNSLDKFIFRNKGKWIFGFLSYDLKNHIQKLKSSNADDLNFPMLHFFVPEKVFMADVKGQKVIDQKKNRTEKYLSDEQEEIILKQKPVNLKQRINREEYIQKVNQVKEHIQRGDIYELNLCMEFFAEHSEINPAIVFEKMNIHSPAPFSCFYKTGNKLLLSASPERFLCKRGNKLFSQPMKGTVKRGVDAKEDERLKNLLYESEKERAENVMIVDLVRNDLSRVAQSGSVAVDELFGIYTFPSVHQMISTVSCDIKKETAFSEIIRASFPMGSMTGAPKIRAMQLIDEFEESRRGLFSGAAGYISPNGDFDFNVIIRSLLYNAEKKYISLQTGSAITSKSDAEREYEECLLKAERIKEILKSN